MFLKVTLPHATAIWQKTVLPDHRLWGYKARDNPPTALTSILSYKLCRRPKSQAMTRLIEEIQIQNPPCIAAESTEMWFQIPGKGLNANAVNAPASGCTDRCSPLWASFVSHGRKWFMRSTKHFADLPNQSPQSSNHCTDGGGEKTALFTVWEALISCESLPTINQL